MDHKIAVKKLAAQRYMLGEMTPVEREQFESHYFACPECAEVLMDTAAFVDNLKAVLAEEKQVAEEPERWWRILVPWRGGFPAMIPAMAAAVFCVIAGYQQFIRIPALRASLAPRPAVAALIRPSDVRGEIPVVNIDRGAAYATALVLADLGSGARHIQFEIRRADHTPVDFVTMPVPPGVSGGAQVQIPLQAEKFTPGRYTASLRERASESAPWSEVVATYEFEVQKN